MWIVGVITGLVVGAMLESAGAARAETGEVMIAASAAYRLEQGGGEVRSPDIILDGRVYERLRFRTDGPSRNSATHRPPSPSPPREEKPAVVEAAKAQETVPVSKRIVWLWGALATGLLVLAVMAWSLFRGMEG